MNAIQIVKKNYLFYLKIGIAGECSFSADSQKCLICSDSSKFLYDPTASGTSCVASSQCPSSKTAVLGTDTNTGNN